LLLVGALTGSQSLTDRAVGIVGDAAGLFERAASSMGAMLRCANDALAGMRTVSVIGAGPSDPVPELLRALWSRKVPAAVSGRARDRAAARPAELSGRVTERGEPTATVCWRGTCGMPIASPEELTRVLAVRPLATDAVPDSEPGPAWG
jgi:uncharacterized protein YyaL (SSP411 family)